MTRLSLSNIKSVLMTTDTVGGVWNYSVDLCKGLGDFNIEVCLVSMGKKPDLFQRKQVSRLSNVIFIETNYKLEWMEDPWDDVFEAGKTLLQIEKDYMPDVVHVNGYVHGSLPFAAPVLIAAHSCVYSWFDAVRNSRPGSEWLTYYNKVSRALSCADMIVAPSISMLNELKRIYLNFENYKVIYNGSDIYPGRKPKEPFVFSAGRLWDEAKNIECLDKAAINVNWPVYVAGQNRHPDGGKIIFENIKSLGTLTRPQMVDYMSRACVFAMPVKYEPFGLSILEAALCKCVLVLGNIKTLREIWQDCAVYADPNEPSQFAKQINRLIEQPELLKYYSKKALQKAELFTIRRMINEYVSLYGSMVSAKQLMPKTTAYMKG
jgi:glycosyltransferase involved in cell wall biosynthesis